MKHITSTTGSKIDFNLNSTRKIIIDPIVPVAVEDLEYNLLDSRLGSQILLVDFESYTPRVAPKVVKSKEAPKEVPKVAEAPKEEIDESLKDEDEVI